MKHLTLLLLVAGLVAGTATGINTKPSYCEFPPLRGKYTVVFLEHHDGDTATVGLIVPLHLRTNGIDAPELRTKEGPKAREVFIGMTPAVPTSFLFEAEFMGREKYGRTLADYVTGDGKVSVRMVEGGNAKPWSGKGPKP